MSRSPRKNKWFRLDNAAKIFPPSTGKKDPKVFRFACELKEKVDPLFLKSALTVTMDLFPDFQVVLKRGLFWYYLETTNLQPTVEEEKMPPCSMIYDKNSKSLLFRVSYYGTRINFEIYHALSDGTGALQFLKVLVGNYCMLVHPEDFEGEKPVFDYDASLTEKMADSFEKYYDPKKAKISSYGYKAYQLKGDSVADHQIRIIEGQLSSQALLALARDYHTTITVLVVAIYFMAIESVMSYHAKKRPVVITVPVNLRKYFSSVTARNFFSVINVGISFHEGALSLEEMIVKVDALFQEELQQEKVERRMNQYAAMEHNFLARLVPLFLKDFILKIAYMISERGATAAVSNVGRVTMPSVFDRYIARFDVFVSTGKQQICMCSYQDAMTITFSSALESTDIIKEFFRLLSAQGLEVTIVSNQIGE